jgi:hypothetical protein
MDSNKKTILSAFRMIFRPIAKILLLAGITWKEISEVCKATLVEVAGDEFGIRGRRTNASRVAILTGFTRKEVARLRELLAAPETQLIERMNHATRVLTGCDSGSFESLCKRYASDVPATTMLKELKQVGAVVDGANGQLIAQTRYYIPRQMDPELVLSSGSVMQDLGNTVAHNLYRQNDRAARFERRAHNTRVAASVRPQFQEFLEQEGQEFLERVDAWLSDHETDDNDADESIRLGLGTYWIEQ